MKRTPLKRKPFKSKPRKATGELELFKEIWKDRPHICQVTGEPIREFHVQHFAHILSKGAYPRYRLNKNNIALVTKEVHYEWDFGRNKSQYEYLVTQAEKLKQEYYIT